MRFCFLYSDLDAPLLTSIERTWGPGSHWLSFQLRAAIKKTQILHLRGREGSVPSRLVDWVWRLLGLVDLHLHDSKSGTVIQVPGNALNVIRK